MVEKQTDSTSEQVQVEPNEETVVEERPAEDVLADILGDPDEGTEENKAEGAEAGEETAEGEDAPEDDEAEQEEGDQPEADYSRGRFAADDAQVRLEDGSTVTVSELKQGNLRQGDYTRKTQDLADQRRNIEAERQKVTEVAQQLTQGHEQVVWWLDQLKPQRPEVAYSDDPASHGEYQDRLQQWNEAKTFWDQKRQQDMQALQAQQQERFNEYRNAERDALFEAIPALRDDGKRAKFTEAAVQAGRNYGFSEQEIRAAVDHRLFLVLKDAMAYRRLQDKLPKVKADLESKPAMITGSKRVDSKAKSARTRQAKTERLRKEGTHEAGLSVLMDMDL